MYRDNNWRRGSGETMNIANDIILFPRSLVCSCFVYGRSTRISKLSYLFPFHHHHHHHHHELCHNKDYNESNDIKIFLHSDSKARHFLLKCMCMADQFIKTKWNKQKNQKVNRKKSWSRYSWMHVIFYYLQNVLG